MSKGTPNQLKRKSVHEADALSGDEKQRMTAAETGSAALKRAMFLVVEAQARVWGITHEQTRRLLLDRKVAA